MINNVTLNNKICCGCGLCESVCHQKAIVIFKNRNGFLRPRVSKKCINCGLCLKCCPADKKEPFDYKNFIKSYYGHSNNSYIRFHASSGGVVTELLSYLLSEKIIDYAIVSDNNCFQNIVNGEIINDKKDLTSKAGSKYCPVNIGHSISQIKQKDGKCAIVCLPCVARGISLLKKFNPELNSKISFVFSLVCNHVPSYNGTTFFIKKNGIKRPNSIQYRGDGWYSNVKVSTSKKTHEIPFRKFYKDVFSNFFWQESCIGCLDHFGKYADASFGDADFIRHREEKGKNNGETMVFVNNHKIDAFLLQMQSRHIISFFNDYSNSDIEWIFGSIGIKDEFKNNLTECNSNKLLRAESARRFKEHLKSVGSKIKKVFILKK